MKITAMRADMNMASEKLSPCPDSPNCVQSQYPEHKSYIPPLTLANDGQPPPMPERIKERWRLLGSIVLSQPRTRLVEKEANTLRVEFRSLLFRFIDDVEFLLDDKAGLVHVRSASRMGHYDFGVNRKRIQMIRSLFNKAIADQSSGGT